MRNHDVRKGYLLCVITLIILFAAVLLYKFLYTDNVQAGVRKLTDEQWSEDINFISNAINNDEHALFDSKNKFNDEINNIKKDLHSLSDTEIELRLMEAAASIGNDHTYVSLDYSWPAYPIYLFWCGDELRALGVVDNKYENLLGKKLISINGIGIEQVLDKLGTVISHETDQWLRKSAVDYITTPSVLKYCGIIKYDDITWTFQDDNGQVVDVVLPVVQWDNNSLQTLKIKASGVQSLPEPDAGSFTGYWYKYIPEDKILYFQYNTCLDKATAEIVKSHGFNTNTAPNSYPDFNDFLEGLYKIIDNEKIDKFIIDLRKNGGGYRELLANLISKLSNDDNLNKKGKLFVLIGKGTFSAAAVNCLTFKEMTNAIFIGEPTGGLINEYADLFLKQLPNSKLTLGYTLQLTITSKEYSGPMVPDITVNQSFQDYLNNIDDVYEAVKNY